MKPHVVRQPEWNEAQKRFFEKEEQFNRARNELSAARRALPWVKVEKSYIFQGADGPETLADLFDGRRQLVMQHFMFTPEWEEGCSGCSVQADSVDGARYHFEPKGVSFVAVSRAPVAKLQAFRQRMGWKFKWVSSGESDFNYDFGVSFTKPQIADQSKVYNFGQAKADMEDLPGISVFYRDDSGDIFRTYSNYSGDQLLLPLYGYLDITPVGRNEQTMFDWIKHHDKY